MTQNNQSELKKLRQLATEPDAQADYALELLRAPKRGRYTAAGRERVGAAVRVLSQHPPFGKSMECRTVLLDVYHAFHERGETRDPGSYVRAGLLNALRPHLKPDDVHVLTDAAATYEYLPPEFTDEATVLRAAALIGLNELDDQLAQLFGARLLVDAHTQRMSGEPALTAARVLGTQSAIAPLYLYAMLPPNQTLPEVVSECLRNLTTLPPALLPELMERYGQSGQDVVLAGLFDLLLGHEEGPYGRNYFTELLKTTRQMDAYRYLVATTVSHAASGAETILPELLEHARWEQNREKVAILLESLSVLAHHPEVEDVMDNLSQRM